LTRAEILQLAARARQIYARGTSKQIVFETLAAGVDKPMQVARLVASLPNPEGVRRYRTSNRILAGIVFIIAMFAGLEKFAVGVNLNLTAGILAAAVFFGIFAWCALGIWNLAFPAYTSTVILLFLALTQAPRALLGALSPPDGTTDGTGALFFTGDVVLGVLLPLFLLWFTVRVRNNIFSKTNFFGSPKKDKNGNFLFASAWEAQSGKH